MTQVPTNQGIDNAVNNATDLNTPEGRAASNISLAMQNPTAIPAKFKNEDGTVNVELLTQSYVALEHKLSDQNPNPLQQQKADLNKIAELAAPNPTIEDQLNAAGADDKTGDTAVTMEDILRGESQTLPKGTSKVDWAKVENEMRSTGRLTNETIKGLTDSGVPKEMIAVAVNGIKAKQKEDMDRAASLLGGAEELSATLNWAKDNLSEEQRKTLIAQLNSPMGEQILLGLNAQYKATKPQTEGQLIDTSKGGGGGTISNAISSEFGPVTAFADFREQQAAMGDPRYNAMPAYRQWVGMRLLASRGRDPQLLAGRNF